VAIAVPEAMRAAEIEKIIRGKQEWLYTALARKDATTKGPPAKEYVTGEGFYYLGRKYRLKLADNGEGPSGDLPLELQNGRFVLARGLAAEGRALFVRWYAREAGLWIGKRVNALKARVAAHPLGIEIRDLGFRWGSCTPKGKLFFHWRTVLLPPEQIDYLVLHELVHVHEHNHSAGFYERLRRASPDHKVHEAWFRKHGDEYRL
jgi:predicted metal-dependent hydrolase